MFRFVLILFFCLPFASLSQEDKGIFDLINKANTLVNDDTEEALDLIEDALRQSIEVKNLRAEGYCYNTLGAINYKLELYDQSVSYYLKSIRLFKSVNDSKGLYNSTKYISVAYEADNKLKKAYKYYLIFYEMAGNNSAQADLLEATYSLGRVSFNSGDYETAKKYFKQAREKEVANGNEVGIAEADNWLGMIEEKLGNQEKAWEMYSNTNEQAIKNQDVENANRSYDNLSNFYQTKGKKQDYMEVQQQAYEYNSEQGDRKKASENAMNLAEANLESNKPDVAIPYIKSSINIAKELGDLEDLSAGNLLLSKAYEQQGDYNSALKEYKNYLLLVDSMNNERAKEELLALRMSQELNHKITEIKTLEQELREKSEDLNKSRETSRKELKEQSELRRNDRIIMYSLASVLLIAIISSILVFRSSKQKRRANQLLALKSLRSQMNPHFIFNSLNSVNSFIASNDERSANKYLSEFSRLMRAVLENSKHDFVSLSSELDILRLYLDLEHLRFSDKFDYTFEVDIDVDPEQVEIPPMLIQPYIENSIWHGLRYKEEKGYLKVKFKELNGVLQVIIEDDGIGRKKSQELKTLNQKANKSTGMKNIEGRLNLLNELHKMQLGVQVTDLEGPDTSGTRVEISIPFNTNQEAA